MLEIWKRVLKLALPSIAAFSSMTFTGMITLVIIGRLGASSIAVVGITNILIYNTWAFFAGINETVNYLVSQNFGENTMAEGNERTQIAVVVSVALSFLLLAVSFVLPHFVFVWLGANHVLVQLGTPYLRVRWFAFCFTLLSNVFYAYMRSVGDTKTPMYISLVTNALLVGLTYGLTYGRFGMPRLGLMGAGWSMVMTEGLALVSSCAVYYGWYHRRFQTRTWYRMHPEQIRLVLWESVKLSAMELSQSLGMLVFTACITRLGTVAVAANEITLNILSLGFMPANGFGAAATIAVGQEVGAARPRLARRIGLHTVLLGLIFMGLFSIFLWVFSLPVAKLYTQDAAVYVMAVSLIHIASFIQLFDGGGIILAGGLRGIGDTTFLFRFALILNWVIFVPLTIVLTVIYPFGQVGAWIALCILIILIAVTNGWRYLALRWEELVSRSARMAAAPTEPVSETSFSS